MEYPDEFLEEMLFDIINYYELSDFCTKLELKTLNFL